MPQMEKAQDKNKSPLNTASWLVLVEDPLLPSVKVFDIDNNI